MEMPFWHDYLLDKHKSGRMKMRLVSNISGFTLPWLEEH
jgi:hypothetical protein